MILRNVTIRALEKPIFWLPYLNIPLGNEAPVELIMGQSDELGSYIRTAKRMAISRYVQIKPHYDWFSRRGHGFGLDTQYQLPEIGEGEVLLYQIRDRNAPDPRAATHAATSRSRCGSSRTACPCH